MVRDVRDELLTMRVSDLMVRSIAKRCVSKDETIEVENALRGRAVGFAEHAWLLRPPGLN
jgi:hypothetical protein